MFKVSKGNSKLGRIYNINLPSIISCAADAPCKKYCYANKGTYKFPSVKNCYQENLDTFLNNAYQAETDILMQLPHIESEFVTLYCRVHSSGDFYNMTYLKMIIRICLKRPYIKFLAYTKKYDLINTYVAEGGIIPKNLIIVFSNWKGYNMPNPFNMPVAVVEGFTDLNTQGFACTGQCELCYYCWRMLPYDKVVFKKH